MMTSHEEWVEIGNIIWKRKTQLTRRIEKLFTVPKSLRKNLEVLTQAEEICLASPDLVPWMALKAIGATDEVVLALKAEADNMTIYAKDLTVLLEKAQEELDA